MSGGRGDIALRQEAPTDFVAVHALLRQAFGGPGEAGLVDRLRANSDLVLALVAIAPPDTVVGHIAFSRLAIETTNGMHAAVGLAPLAVALSHRRRGVGAALARFGLEQLMARDETIVFVLGDPGYYSGFGFEVAAARTFSSAYAGPHFQVRRLAADAPLAGALHYPAAFDDLG